jgi:hypothetical protein
VAFELKTGRFEPEHKGKLSFYLEALDRDRKPRTKTLASVCFSAAPRTMKSWNMR